MVISHNTRGSFFSLCILCHFSFLSSTSHFYAFVSALRLEPVQCEYVHYLLPLTITHKNLIFEKSSTVN